MMLSNRTVSSLILSLALLGLLGHGSEGCKSSPEVKKPERTTTTMATTTTNVPTTTLSPVVQRFNFPAGEPDKDVTVLDFNSLVDAGFEAAALVPEGKAVKLIGGKKSSLPEVVCKLKRGVCFYGDGGKATSSNRAPASTCPPLNVTYDSSNGDCTFIVSGLKEADSGQWLVLGSNAAKPIGFNVMVEKETMDDDEESELKTVNKTGCFMSSTLLRGHNIYTFPTEIITPTELDCHIRCLRNSNCFYWSWDKAEFRCSLKGRSAPEGAGYTEGVVSGPKRCPGCYKVGIGYVATPLPGVNANNLTNAAGCQTLCSEDKHCSSFTYNVADSRCALFAEQEPEEKESLNAVSGPEICLQDALPVTVTPAPSVDQKPTTPESMVSSGTSAVGSALKVGSAMMIVGMLI